MNHLFPAKTSSPTILLKARIKHTRYFLLIISPLLFVTRPVYPEFHIVHASMDCLGHLLVICGVFVRVFASVYIGGRKNDELVTVGLFSIVRNPLYVGTFIAMTGLCMFTASFIIIAFFMVVFAFYYRATVAREELFLETKFGPAYTAYTASVPRWWPRFELWASPDIIESKPQFIWRTIRDAIPFVIAMPVLEMLCLLRSNSALPVLFTLP